MCGACLCGCLAVLPSHALLQVIEERQRNPALGVRQIPLLLCGDLNSLPGSGVVEYLQSGEISVTHPDFLGKEYKGYLARISEDGKVAHSFQLSQVFDKQHALPFTNRTHDFTGVIDYIFHTTGFLQVREVVGPPDQKWLDDNRVPGFPNPHYPSDHIPLIADIEMCIKSPYLAKQRSRS